MKIKLNDQHKQLSLALFLAGAGLVLLYFIFSKFATISAILTKIYNIVFPFIVGFALAILLLPLLKFFERYLSKYTNFKAKNIRLLSSFGVLLFLIGCICLIGFLIIPNLITSLIELSSKLSVYLELGPRNILPFLKQLELDQIVYDWWINDGQAVIKLSLDTLKNAFPSLVTYSLGFISKLLGIIIGVVVMVYGLIFKDRLAYQTKIIMYALFPKNHCDKVIAVSKLSQRIFNDFVIGKLIDSLIIGVICFIGLLILKIEYPFLIATIVGVTNIIPVFGPFVGAVPGILILFIINPIKALIFAFWILILQQFDGNILGPYILGDKVGLPSLWVLFSIIVGGGLFGLLGMFIGVPVFAIIYRLVKDWSFKKLEAKNLKADNL